MSARKKGLGRGLDALLGEARADYGAVTGETPVAPDRTVPIENLYPGRMQPRRGFDEEALAQLAESIKRHGLLQPLLVRPRDEPPESFEIVAGERRWRAAQRAQIHTVPVIIQPLDDSQALEIGLIENLQRQDLSAVEEAAGYRRLLDEFGYAQGDLASAIGKSRSHVANSLRLLSLPEPVQALIQSGELSAGHARTLIGAPEPEALARQIVAQGLSVREAEALAHRRRGEGAQKAAKPRKSGKDVDTLALEEDLSSRLGLKVSIDQKGKGGRLTLAYNDLDQLDELIQRLVAWAKE